MRRRWVWATLQAGLLAGLWFAGTSGAQAQVAASVSADAAGDDDDKPISVALLAGYGVALDVPGELNPFGVGFGVRGGYNLGAIYLGARFMFFLGESEEVAGMEVSASAMTIGLEGGYDIELTDSGLFLRPELGIGLAITSGESMGGPLGTVDQSSEDLYIAPGAALLGCVAERLFIGGDVQVPIIFGTDTVIGLTILATGGLRF